MSDLLDACIRRTVELVALAKPDLILTDPRLKELINSSYETIVLRLANQGLNSLRQEIVLEEIRAGTTELTTTTDPAIPEISQIIRAWERAYGGTSWTEMRKVIDHLPVNATPASNLIWYDFRNGALQFVGSTGANDVKLHFAPRAASFTMPRDAFAFPDLVNPVAPAADPGSLSYGCTRRAARNRAAACGTASSAGSCARAAATGTPGRGLPGR